LNADGCSGLVRKTGDIRDNPDIEYFRSKTHPYPEKIPEKAQKV